MKHNMNTDDLRTLYGKQVHFNCQSGDEAFTDDYVLWLEKHLMEQLHKLNDLRSTHFDCTNGIYMLLCAVLRAGG